MLVDFMLKLAVGGCGRFDGVESVEFSLAAPEEDKIVSMATFLGAYSSVKLSSFFLSFTMHAFRESCMVTVFTVSAMPYDLR